ncbi:MAG: bifunctional diaminohydroxyphosphoribosylaminopyrimidine deaminase/5-amino-6-(5-phosphoribosylamino)uracil reductase RibD [Bacteroidales bacterium]|nr:bifunctional diaminohydroxyphosphoribosylaminopyrimidine deaminase/5-amino-6-(5-phosphoribosylamino)uracil reductase RibD [Bacteroidales bacterium]
MTNIHDLYIQRCIDLAGNGLGLVAPNPMVGAVVVHNEQVIGEGFHTAYGKSHAEVEAINQVKDQSLLPDSTLYVNLEPCNHQGKTPPCTDLILRTGIKRVVIGQTDPNSTASGGIDKLRENGVEVITGVLNEASRQLNRRFNTYHEQHRPYLIFKWAQTTDGFVDTLREKPDNQNPAWITGETCRMLVHKWRAEEPAILTGSRTILLDNPQLNVRCWTGKNPLRITIDRKGVLRQDKEEGDRRSPLHIFDGVTPSVIYTCADEENRPNVEFIRISPDEPVWPQVMADLYKRKIQSILIEGGPTLFETLIREDLWDEARVFIGPGWFGIGVKAPHFPFQPTQSETIGNSRLLQFYH